MASEVRFYLSIFLRRFHYFALVALAVTGAGIATAILLPPQYRAEAILLVESPQIPNSLAASTVQTDSEEHLEIIRNRLLTRDNLIDIADRYRVFRNRSEMFPDEVVDEMREATSFSVWSPKNQASQVSISFTASHPEATAAVVSAYVTRVLDSNVQLRTGRAEDTMEFFSQEQSRLTADLASKSAAILEFKNKNINSLPENLAYQLDRLDSLRDRATDITNEIASLAQQRERLILIYNVTGGATSGQDLRSPVQRELDSLRDELASALVIYSEQNPKVKVLQAKIGQLEAAVAASPSSGEADAPSGTPTVLDLQLDELDSRVKALKTELEAIEPIIAQLQKNVEATPAIGIKLDVLQREYDNIQVQYNQAVSRSAAAATGERIELLSKGGRITVISQPVVPRTPASPNRPAIAVAGAGAGVALGLGFVVLLELMNRAIRRPVDLNRALGIVPIATLPLMRTPREAVRRRLIVLGGILLATAGIVAAIVAIHILVEPIDLLFDRLVEQFGF